MRNIFLNSLIFQPFSSEAETVDNTRNHKFDFNNYCEALIRSRITLSVNFSALGDVVSPNDA